MRSTLATLAAAALWAWARPGVAEAPALLWSDATESPRPVLGPHLGGVDGRDRDLLSRCDENDPTLDEVAAQIAAKGAMASDVEAVTFALRVAGEPHVWPRALVLQGRDVDHREARARFDDWLAGFHGPGRLRCGVARARNEGGEIIAAVALVAQADLDRIPTRVRTGSWINLSARVLVPASAATVVVLGPTGAPRTAPTSLVDGRLQARAYVDRPGTWTFQVLLDGSAGPRPVLEALVFAGVEPPAEQPSRAAPGDEHVDTADPVRALTQMVDSARQSEALPALERDEALDRVARAHCEHMRRAGQVAHDVGFGDPQERVDRAGIIAREVGENVAHARTILLAHRALWASPSHRDNLLARRFDRLGIGVRVDTDGSVWATEVFARYR